MSECAVSTCDRPTNSSFLCFTCTDRLRRDLVAVKDVWRELDIVRTRQARIVRDHVGSRSSTRPLPWNEHAAQVATDLWATLNAWALDISQRCDTDIRDQLSDVSDDPVDVSRWLIRNMTALNTHPEAGDASGEIGDAVIRSWRAVDLPPDRVFAGPCNSPIEGEKDPCTEDLYGVPGRARLRCMSCKAEHELKVRREWMLGAVEDEVAHSGLLSGLVTSLGVPIASSTIRYYASKGRIKVISVDSHRRPLYRIGDVLDVFLKRAA